MPAKKFCRKESDKAYYQANKEYISARDKAKRQANLEETRAKDRAYYAANKERKLLQARAAREKRREELAKKQREYAQANKERVYAQQKAWREANRHYVSIRGNAYYLKRYMDAGLPSELVHAMQASLLIKRTLKELKNETHT